MARYLFIVYSGLTFYCCLLIAIPEGIAQSVSPVVLQTALPAAHSGMQQKVFTGNALTVVLVFSPDCPMCRSYTLTLKNMMKKFNDGVNWVAIFPGTGIYPEDVIRFRDKYQFDMTLLMDTAFVLSHALKATVTPEVFLIGPSGRILYQGAVDNWLSDLGKKRTGATQHYLSNALEAALNQKQITVSKTVAKGCLINDY